MRSYPLPRSVTLAASIAALISPVTGLAQNRPANTSPIDEVIVTSSRIPVPLRQIGTSVSVITLEDIAAHGNVALTDVLRQMPAVATSSNGGAGKATSLRIRGEEGFRTLTLFDGLRLSDPSSTQITPQLEHLLSSGVGRVEILRGPQGLSYGADAGGIVNISSRQGEPGTQIDLDAQTGAYGTRQYSANIGGANAGADFFISASNFATDGFNAYSVDNVLRDDDGYANTTLHLRGGVNVTDTLRFDLVQRVVDGDTQLDGCFDPATFATVHDCAGPYDVTATRAALSHDGANFSHSIAYATTETERDNLTAGVSTFSAQGELNRWEYIGSATNLSGFDLVFGGDLEEALNNGTGRDNTGFYGEVLSDFSDNVFFTAGVRHDDNDDFGTNTSHRVSGAYLIDMANAATLKFKASHGSGFRAPSPYEIAYNAGAFSYPPASLVTLSQETSEGHEFGIEYLAPALRLEAVYFDQDVEDALFFDLAAFSGYLQDVGISTSKGYELAADWTVGESWRLTGNYTHNATRQPNGEQRRRRPEELMNVGVSYYGMNERLNVNAWYRISRDATDGAVVLDDFEVLDLSANFDVTDKIRIYGRLENALDEEYQEIAGYFTAERAAYFGFKLRYDL